MKIRALIAICAAALLPTLATADTFTDEKVKQLALEAILENPEIIMQAVALLEQRDQDAQRAAANAVLTDQRDLLENDPNAPVLANPIGDVTIVEFFDYNCPYCRRATPQVDEVVAADSGVRLVYREWPILGEGSVFAARAALASRKQDLYEPFHVAMMSMQGRANEQTVLKIAMDVGLDIAQLRADMDDPLIDQHIQTSMELAQALGFSGTPSFVIGDQLVPGFVEADVLLDAVGQTRTSD